LSGKKTDFHPGLEGCGIYNISSKRKDSENQQALGLGKGMGGGVMRCLPKRTRAGVS